MFLRNVVTFGVDNSSSIHSGNCKYNFFVLGEGLEDNINCVGPSEKKFSINFTKSKTRFCLSFH